MIFLSDRMELERLFDEWAREHHVLRFPNAVISFLQIKGMLDEKVVKDYLKVYGYRRGGELLEKGEKE